MNASEALARLHDLRTPVVTTADGAALLGVSIDAANKTLKRLAKAGLMLSLRHGLWAVGKNIDPLLLPDYLTAPYPSYVSLQSALYLHGMISQIPQVTYVVSLDRAQRIRTSVGTMSIHRVAPSFFGGFELLEAGVKLATPEKALLDVFYLSGTRSRLFAALPEIELPRGFRFREARAWLERIPSRRLRTVVASRLEAIASRSPVSR
jgi:predicted transcriptional regulator of viral defense system